MNHYQTQIHQRRSIRLNGYDYSKVGIYFITICCQDRKNRFGTIENKGMILNELGKVAYSGWAKLQDRFPNFELDVFQIMPNHMHGIILLNDAPVGAGFSPALIDADTGIMDTRATARVSPTVGDIVGAYKSLVANGCLDIYKSKNEMLGKFWQRNYYEHIIRDDQSYQRISQYIIDNPAKWNADKFYTE